MIQSDYIQILLNQIIQNLHYIIIDMKKGNKASSKSKPEKQDDKQYAQFLEEKIKKQHYINHLINHDVSSLDEQNIKQREQILKLRKTEANKNKQIKQLNQEIQMLKNKVNATKFQNQKLQKKLISLQKSIQKQNQSYKSMEAKVVFKQFLNNSFPKHKDTIKRLLRFFMHLQKHGQLSTQKRIDSYRSLIGNLIQRFFNFIFPKKNEGQKSKSIAQNLVQKWKQNGIYQKDILAEVSYLKNKEIKNVDKIFNLQGELLKLNSAKNMLQNRVTSYEKALKIKASEFVVHFKKALVNQPGNQLQQNHQVEIKQVLQIFNSLVHQHQQNYSSQVNKNQSNIVLISNIQKEIKETKIVYQNNSSTGKKIKQKEAPPIVKKNVFGYYKQPQFQKYNNLTLTKHPDRNKFTQTLPDDLAILTLQPILLLHLFDGNIKPQRNRHCTEYYVQIYKNSDNSVSSHSINNLQPFWNRQFLLKDYDFPFLKVNLMNKSKGLRDQIIGQSKLLVQKSQSKIVNVKKQKQFQGRIRFGIWYPKGNIFQFFINSVQLILPQNCHFLTEQVTINCPMNQSVIQKFSTNQRIKFINKSFIILQDYQGDIQGCVKSLRCSGKIKLSEFTKKQGNKQVVIQVQDWKIVLDGYVVLLVCQNQQPQKISDEYAKDDRFFAVRAGHPLVSATYHKLVLYTHVKLPLIFRYTDDCQTLQYIKQTQNSSKLEENIISPLLNESNQLKVHDLLSTPTHIYQFFLVTLQGQQVKFSYQSNLYMKLPENIKLQIANTQLEDESKQALTKDNKMKKGQRALQKKSQNKLSFFIQTKQLMQNHYKIFNKIFKLTSFSKFKLGYKIVKNLLITQGKPKIQAQTIKKQIQVQTPLQGEYFIQIRVQKAYLPALSTSSKYSIQLKNSICQNWQYKTQQISSSHLCPEWRHSFFIKFLFNSNQPPPKFTFRLRQTSLLTNKIVCQGVIPLTRKLLHLGKLYLKLNFEGQQQKFPQQNMIIFSNIKIPPACLSVFIDSIECEVQQKSDWIGEIDPYIQIFKNQHQIYKTNVIDGAGDNSMWTNLQFKSVLSVASKITNQQTNNSKFQLFQCQIFDEDIINDDYLGISKVYFDPQIVNKQTNQINCLRSNIIKDQKITGSLKFTGKFKFIKQDISKIKTLKKKQIESNTHNIYHISVFKIALNDEKLSKSQDTGRISYSNLIDNKKINKKIQFKTKELQKVNFSFWKVVNMKQQDNYILNDKINLTIEHQKSSFLHKEAEVIGQVSFALSEIKQSLNQVRTEVFNILNDKKTVGKCHIFIQPINQIQYSIIDCFSSATNFVAETDMQDSCVLFTNSILTPNITNLNSIQEDILCSYLMCNKNIDIQKYDCKNDKIVPLISYSSSNFDQINDINVKLKTYNTDDNFAVFSLNKQNLYKKQTVYQKYQRNTNKTQQKLYKIKMIHWQPTKFISSMQYVYDLKFDHNHNARHISLNKKLNQTYNSYYLFNVSEQHKKVNNFKQDLIVFDQLSFPKQLQIYSEKNQNKSQNIVINIHNRLEKYQFVKNDGILYYQIQSYTGKYKVLNIQSLFIRMAPNFIQQFFTINKSQELKELDLKLTVNQSQIYYCSAIRIGSDGFLFKNMRFFLTSNVADNKFKLNIKPNNFLMMTKQISKNQTQKSDKQKEVQIQIKGKNNQWEYSYIYNNDYCLHSKVLIQTDVSVGKPLQIRPPPTQISFIQMISIGLTPTARLSSKSLKIKFYLHNQCLQMTATKQQQQNFSYQLLQKQLLYIYNGKQSIIKVQVIQQRVFGDKLLGVGHISLTESDILLSTNELSGQISNKQTIIGKVKFGYKCKPKTKYLYVDVDKIVTKFKYPELIIEMRPIGINKSKYQKINMRLIQNKAAQSQNKEKNEQSFEYDTTEDLIVAQNDYQDYNIHVIILQTLQQIGKFKLCEVIKKDNEDDYQQMSAVHPLRVVPNQLQGLLSINYIQFVSSQKQLQNSNILSNKFFNLVIKNIRYHNQHEHQKLSLLFQTSLRKLYSQEQQITSDQFNFSIILAEEERLNIILMRKDQKLAYASVLPPFIHNQEKIIVFKKYLDNSPFGIFREYFSQTVQNKLYYEIDSLQTTSLADMEYFVKMNPYALIQTCASSDIVDLKMKKQVLKTQISVGKQYIFWKINLILDNSLKVTVYDKDLAFDDYIGQCEFKFDASQLQTYFNQNQLPVYKKQLKLISKEDNNLENGNAIISLRQIKSLSKIQQFKCQFIEKSMFKVVLDDMNILFANDGHLFSRLMIGLRHSKNSNVCKMREYVHEGGVLNLMSKPLLIPFTLIDSESSYVVFQIVDVKANQAIMQQVQINKFTLNAQTKSKYIIFKNIQIIPAKQEIFTIQKLQFWYDFMTFGKNIQISIFLTLDSQSQSKDIQKTFFYELNIDLNQVQKHKNGIHLISINNKQLQKDIRICCNSKMQITIKDKLDNSNKDICNIKIGKELLHNHILQSDIIRTNSQNMKIGKVFLQIDKYQSDFSNLNSSLIENRIARLHDIQSLSSIRKSNFRWIRIKIIDAKLLIDLEWLSKMDPYCEIQYFNQQNKTPQIYRTSVKDDIGQQPAWNQTKYVRLTSFNSIKDSKSLINLQKNQKQFKVRVMDEEVTKNRQIGSGIIKIMQQTESKLKINLMHNEKQQAGWVNLEWCIHSRYIVFIQLEKFSDSQIFRDKTNISMRILDQQQMKQKGGQMNDKALQNLQIGHIYPFDIKDWIQVKYQKQALKIQIHELYRRKEDQNQMCLGQAQPIILRYMIFE